MFDNEKTTRFEHCHFVLPSFLFVCKGTKMYRRKELIVQVFGDSMDCTLCLGYARIRTVFIPFCIGVECNVF